MVEFCMAWLLLLVGFVKWEADWFIASGVFAVACNLYVIIKKNGG
jgi:hypothetical protein